MWGIGNDEVSTRRLWNTGKYRGRSKERATEVPTLVSDHDSEMTIAKPLCTPITETDASVELALLDGGSFIGDLSKIHADVENRKFRLYDWAFYISHQGRHILWDLGI